MGAEVLASTVGMSREDWLAARRSLGLGGSEAAAAAGLDPYKSPMALWLEKTGQVEPEEAGEAAYFGSLLEPIVCDEFTRRTGLRTRRRNAILCHPERRFMIADVDREVIENRRVCAVLDAKTTSARKADDWQPDSIPDRVTLQLHHYMAVEGFDHAFVATLIGGQRFFWARVDRNETIVEHLYRIEADFWRLVETRTPPDPDGSAATAEALAALYPQERPGWQVALPMEAADLIAEHKTATADKRAAEVRVEAAANKLKALLGDAEAGYIAGERVVTWRLVERAEHIVKASAFRQLRVR